MIEWSEKREAMLGKTSKPNLLPDIKLPVLPQALIEFSQLADDPYCEIQKLAAIVESDTGLTCQLLRAVNASVNGLRHKISSAQRDRDARNSSYEVATDFGRVAECSAGETAQTDQSGNFLEREP